MSFERVQTVMNINRSMYNVNLNTITYIYIEQPIFDIVAEPDYPITFEGYSDDNIWAVIQTRILLDDGYWPSGTYQGPWLWVTDSISKRKYMLTEVTYTDNNPDLADVQLLMPFLWGYTTDDTYVYVRLFIPIEPIVSGAFWRIDKARLDADADSEILNFLATHKMLMAYLVDSKMLS